MKINNDYKYIYKRRLNKKIKRILDSVNPAFLFSTSGKSKKRRKVPALIPAKPVQTIVFVVFSLLFFTGITVAVFNTDSNVQKVVENINLKNQDFSIDEHIDQYVSLLETGIGSGESVTGEIPVAAKLKYREYTVRKGDTLSDIAQDNNLSLGTLISCNNIQNVKRLYGGMKIKIPDRNGVIHKVKRGDCLETIARKYNGNYTSMLDANDIQSEKIVPGQSIFVPEGKLSDYELKRATGRLFIYPTRGRKTSGFGYRKDPFTGKLRKHYGLDLANSYGTSIYASMEGTVVYVDYRKYGFGNYVLVKHTNGYQTIYAHMSKVLVKKGQWLKQGQLIGKMGSTGRSTGNHLHFAIYKNNIPVDPERYLSK